MTTIPTPTRRVDELIALVAQAALDEETAKTAKTALRAELCAAALWVQEQTGTKPTLRHDDATISLTVPEGSLALRGDGQEYLTWRVKDAEDVVEGVVTTTVRVPAAALTAVQLAVHNAVQDVLSGLDEQGVPAAAQTAGVLAAVCPVSLDEDHEALVDDGRLVAVYDRATGEEVPGLKWNPPAAPYVSVRPSTAAKARAAGS